MSSYIIAGSADSIDTAYCEEIARRIKAKYKNIDFRVVIKHPSEWEGYLQEVCRVYGFLRKSNPIVYTFDGKIIGGKDNFLLSATKYFGLDQQQLIVENLTSKTNMKLAEQQLKVKKIQKSNFKTLQEKIDLKYKQLLGKGVLRYAPKQKEVYLVNGIEYIHRELEGLVQPIKFTRNREVPVISQIVEPEEINLMALSLQDQIKPEEGLPVKETFVTNNQKPQHPPSQHDRMSQASKTGKLHESMVSYDKDSRGVKDSNKTKLRIDQQNDDVPDYVDEQLRETVVCELADQFFVAFDPQSVVGEELIFYLNADPNGNAVRLHNDGRPIKGHRVVVREVHYEEQESPEKRDVLAEMAVEAQEEVLQAELEEGQKEEEREGEKQKEGEKEKEKEKEKENLQVHKERKLTVEIEKSKTQPNIPAIQSQKQLKAQQDIMSEPNSDLNILSHLNHHTLFIHKPLSVLQLKNLLYYVKQTDTIATLQFLPQSPNPRVKLYVRKLLVSQEGPLFQLPVERFIAKQLEDKQFREVVLPSENGEGMIDQTGETFRTLQIAEMGFNHLLFQLGNEGEERVHKVIKFAIDHFLTIEEELRRDIGYNLVLTKKFLLLVPLVESYEVYNNSKLYLDGLAFLGFIHTALTQKSYSIVQPLAGSEDVGQRIRKMLAVSSGYNLAEQ